MLYNNYVQSELNSKVKNLEHSFEYMLGIMVDQIKKASHLNHELDEFKSGILSLVQGKLSPLLIPADVLYMTLSEINNLLKSKYPGFHLSISSLNDVYSDCGYLFARNGSKIYVTLKIPVSHSRKPFSLYKVMSFPVPINVTSVDATQLLDLPNYFIVSNTQQQYSALNDFDYSLCSGSKTKYCSFNIEMNPKAKRSCILAIFDNDIDGVKSLCNFRYIQNVITPKIVEVEPNSLLLYRTPILSLQCLDHFRQMSGCDFCIVNIPCRCSVSATDVYAAPRLASCHIHNDNITVLHPVNLALLQHFFDKSYVKNILADTNFRTALNITIPKLKLYEHEMSNVLAADTKAHLSLSKMAAVAKKDEVIFQSLTEPLLENQIQLSSDWPDMNDILLLGTMGVTVLLMILLFYTFFKVRKLSTALLVLQQVQQVKSLSTTVPNFIYKPKTIAPQLSQSLSLDLKWEHANFVLLFFILLFIVVYILKKFCKTQKRSTICLEISNGEKCVLLDIAQLSRCPSSYHINVPASISDFYIEGHCMSYKLTVSWPGFSIVDKQSEETTLVTSAIPVNMSIAKKLINRSTFTCTRSMEICLYL